MSQDFYNFFYAKDSRERRLNASYEFLRTGVIFGPLGGSKCYSSADCGSGWACVNNECVYLSQTQSENDCSTGPSGSGGCGGGSGCGTSTPGTSCLAADCCGDRCCRYTAVTGGPVVNCYCGKCPEEEKECTSFCDSYYKNSGRQAEGCSGYSTCSECSYCGSSGRCVVSNGGPCWCNVTRNCELCLESGNWVPDPNCWPCRNFTKCGVPTGERYCSPGLNGSLALLKSVNGRLIDEPCDIGCESGTNCETKSIELAGNPPENGLNTPVSSIYPGCCSGCECKLKGYVSAAGMTTYLVEECDLGALPDDCCKVECNCNSECSDCEICDQYGQCAADPNCGIVEVPEYYPVSSTATTFSYAIGRETTALTYCSSGSQAKAAASEIVTGGTVTRSGVTGWKYLTRSQTLTWLCNTYDSNVTSNNFIGFRLQFANGTTEDIGVSNVQAGTTVRAYPEFTSLQFNQVSGSQETYIAIQSIT